jgi:PAS domain S-box-containing protein
MTNIRNNAFAMNEEVANILWDMSPIVITMIDEEGKFLYVNHMAQHFWEYTEAELRQKKWQDITHPEDLPADVSMHKMLKDGQQRQYTMCKRYITKSGRVVWGSLTVHPLNDTSGRTVHFLSQVIPLDNYIHGSQQDEIYKVMPANEVKPPKNEKVSVSGYIMKHLPNFISLLFVLIGGIYVFSADLGANKQKINNVEEDIKKVEKKVDSIERNAQEQMKILLEIKNSKESKK